MQAAHVVFAQQLHALEGQLHRIGFLSLRTDNSSRVDIRAAVNCSPAASERRYYNIALLVNRTQKVNKAVVSTQC